MSDQMHYVPRHVAIVMDGNGRWARARKLPRTAGHVQGVNATRKVIRACSDKGVKVLTLFAFSSENWKRPESEVSAIMELFFTALRREIKQLEQNNVKMRFIGDRSRFSEKLQNEISRSEQFTAECTGMTLLIAANYGGRQDIVNAMQHIAGQVVTGELSIDSIDEQSISQSVDTAGLPDPDLFIRTGGEKRISNFLLWQLAYAELYFSDQLWPDFSESELDKAFAVFSSRERRFGMTSEQVTKNA